MTVFQVQLLDSHTQASTKSENLSRSTSRRTIREPKLESCRWVTSVCKAELARFDPHQGQLPVSGKKNSMEMVCIQKNRCWNGLAMDHILSMPFWTGPKPVLLAVVLLKCSLTKIQELGIPTLTISLRKGTPSITDRVQCLGRAPNLELWWSPVALSKTSWDKAQMPNKFKAFMTSKTSTSSQMRCLERPSQKPSLEK